MKQGRVQEVFSELSRAQQTAPNHEGLQDAIRYISNRPGQFDYLRILSEDLPIGSGKIESSHRHTIQKRLKKAGAWWKRENATIMAELRVLRANEGWDLLWQEKTGQDELEHVA